STGSGRLRARALGRQARRCGESDVGGVSPAIRTSRGRQCPPGEIMRVKRIGILVGGGPAPGTNGVIAAAALEAIKRGCTPIGFQDGFEWLAQRYTDEQRELTIDDVSRIHLDGGVLLGSRRVVIHADAG